MHPAESPREKDIPPRLRSTRACYVGQAGDETVTCGRASRKKKEKNDVAIPSGSSRPGRLTWKTIGPPDNDFEGSDRHHAGGKKDCDRKYRSEGKMGICYTAVIILQKNT